MKKITVNGIDHEWRFLQIGYEDVSKLAFEDIVLPGLSCIYTVPLEKGGSLEPGEKTLCKHGMGFIIGINGNA